jgi:hypothetical protein
MMERMRLAAMGLAAWVMLSAPSTALGATTIDTTGSWNGFLDVCQFGVPNTATYGQVARVPATDTVLDSFTFYVRESSAPGTITFRGEVFAWDGEKATGPSRWESDPRTLTLSSSFQPVVFRTGGVQLVPGQQYILFGSVSKDYESNDETSRSCWGFLYQDVYPGGGFVHLNNFGDESHWTTAPWETHIGDGLQDLAFKASFSPPLPNTKNQCKNGGWRTYGVFKNQGDCVSFVATGGKNRAAQGG